MCPSAGHRLRDLGRVEVGKDLLDTPQLGKGVDAPRAKGMNKLIFVILNVRSVSTTAFFRNECR